MTQWQNFLTQVYLHFIWLLSDPPTRRMVLMTNRMNVFNISELAFQIFCWQLVRKIDRIFKHTQDNGASNSNVSVRSLYNKHVLWDCLLHDKTKSEVQIPRNLGYNRSHGQINVCKWWDERFGHPFCDFELFYTLNKYGSLIGRLWPKEESVEMILSRVLDNDLLCFHN